MEQSTQWKKLLLLLLAGVFIVGGAVLFLALPSKPTEPVTPPEQAEQAPEPEMDEGMIYSSEEALKEHAPADSAAESPEDSTAPMVAVPKAPDGDEDEVIMAPSGMGVLPSEARASKELRRQLQKEAAELQRFEEEELDEIDQELRAPLPAFGADPDDDTDPDAPPEDE